MDLYRLYDAAGALLYVGISNSAIARFAQHKNEKSWFDEVVLMTRTRLGSACRADALEIERVAIEQEKPKYNVVHSTLTHSPKQSPTASDPSLEQLNEQLLWLCDVCNEKAFIIAIHKNKNELHVLCRKHQIVSDDRFDWEIKCENVSTRSFARWWSMFHTNAGLPWDRLINEAATNSWREAQRLESLVGKFVDTATGCGEVVNMPEWQALAASLSTLLNRLNDDNNVDSADMMRVLAYTLRVAAIADCTCKQCDRLQIDKLLWPVHIEITPGGMVEATYQCPHHGRYKVWWGQSMLNHVDHSFGFSR